MQRWAGGEPFLNTLVTDDADQRSFPFRDAVEAGVSTWLRERFGGLNALATPAGVAAMAASLANELFEPGFPGEELRSQHRLGILPKRRRR